MTMGEMLRSLPADAPKDELQKFANACDVLRRK